jgi:RHS repeat-associated protein
MSAFSYGHRSMQNRTMRRTGRIAVLAAILLMVSFAAPPGALPPNESLPLSWMWSWLHNPAALADVTGLPVQEHGSTKRPGHYVGASATKANGGAGRADKVPGGYTMPAAKPVASVTGGGKHGFDPKTSKRDAKRSTATSTVYTNADGTITRNVYQHSVNYRVADGTWQPIDTNLVAAGNGRFRMKANGIQLSVAGTAAGVTSPTDLVTVAVGTGESVGYGLSGAASVTPTTSGSTETYADILPLTDMQLTAFDSGVEENLVLRSPDAPSSWTFPLHLTGVTARMEPDGSVGFYDAAGTQVAMFPHGSMTDSLIDPYNGEGAHSAGVTYELVPSGGGVDLRVTADSTWLHDPARVFPVTVDPTTTTAETGDVYVDNDSSTGASDQNGDNLAVGTYNGGTVKARSFLQFGGFSSSPAYGMRITSASLKLYLTWAYSCTTYRPFYVDPLTQSFTVANLSTATLTGAPTYGSAIGTYTDTSPGAACTNTGGNRSVGKWDTVPLNPGTFNAWSSGASPNYGLAITASETDSFGWKRFTSGNYSSTYQPVLNLTYSSAAPQVDAQYPPSQFVSTSLRPELVVAAHDPDGFPKPLTYDFTVLDGTGATVADSGSVSTRNWVVPAGKLAWGKGYVWTVVASDGALTSSSQTVNSFTTSVPQPAITSSLTQNGGNGFDPANGNYTMSATDANVSAVGPALAIARSYNSSDPRLTSAFGSGWSSIADVKATEQYDVDGSVKTVVVTYPDGSEVAYGKDPAPATTFSSPSGRFATFSAITGGYQLVDKSGTTYAFTHATGVGGQYGITSIADSQARTETFTYNGSNQLTDITSASGRALHLTWSTPTGATAAHVATVATDQAVSGDPTSVSTWTYAYSGDLLTSVCPPTSATHCTTYTYATTSQYARDVLDLGPASYWRLGEPASSTTAVSQVLDNEGTDNGTYSNVTLGATGPHPGTTATAATFNGTSSSVSVKPDVPEGSGDQSISLWFKTTATNGVLLGQSAATLGTTTSNEYVPVLYVGSDGKLVGQFSTMPTTGLLGSLSGAGSGRCLDVTGGVSTDGTAVELYDCHATAGQQWTYTAAGELRVTISGVTKCMDAFNNSTANGTQIDIYTCNNQNNQKWTVGPDGQIVGVASGSCIDAFNKNTTNGTKIELWNCGAALQTNQVWFPTTHASINSNTVVNDGQWHHVVLSAASTTQTLYLDGVSKGSMTGVTIADAGQKYEYIGAGYLGGGWPDQPYPSTVTNLGTAAYFNGTIADVAAFDRPLTAQEVASGYTAGLTSSSLLATLVRPSGNTSTTVAYDPVSGNVATVTDANGGVWHVNAPTYSGSSQVYASTVLGDRPTDYWRLGETGTSDAVNQVNGNTATYGDSGVTRSPAPATGALFSDQGSAAFDGTAGNVSVPSSDISGTGQSTEELWFKTTHPGILLEEQSQLLGSTTCPCMPILWVSPDGSLRGAAPATATVGPFYTRALNKCLDDTGGLLTNGNKIEIWTCNSTTAQSWTFNSDGTITLGGKCLDIYGAGTANSTPVDLYTCNGGANQVWVPIANGLENPNSGKCLADPSSSTTDGTQLIIYTCLGSSSNGQQWFQGIGSTGSVTDGNWHHAVITANGAVQSLYLDGALVRSTTAGATITATTQPYAFVGAGSPGDRALGFDPNSDAYVNGSIAEVAFYPNALTSTQVTAHYAQFTAMQSGSPVKTTNVVDPGGNTLQNLYDLATGHEVAEIDALGNKTQYGYDKGGFLATVIDPRGDETQTEHDVRGNVLQTVTCQDQSTNKCSTVYYTYYPEDTTDPTQTSLTPTPNLKNDLLLSTRDGRSTSATDNTYKTTYAYDATGNQTSVTDPLGRATTTTYTTATTPATDSGYAPAGLPMTSTTPGGRTETVSYDHAGDITKTVDPAGLITTMTYDGLGRMLTKTITSDSFPSGLTTSYTYDKLGQILTQTAPPATDRVTGAVHTAQATTTYNYDSQPLTQTTSDLTGGDAARSTSSTYNADGEEASTTDATGKTTSFTYDAYGNVVTETEADGDVVASTWDAEGHLLTSTMKNYTGNPGNPTAPADLTVTYNTYDPTGRLASSTDAMGWVTSYTYTDNNLPVTTTRSDPSSGASFVEQSNTYDSAGNITQQVTNNGATTVTYAVDAADRTTSTTLDPSGLNRTTAYTYTIDDAVVNTTSSDSTGVLSSTDVLLDAANRTIATTTATSSFAPVARYKLNETTGTTASDSSGNSPATTSGGVTWSTAQGGSAAFDGTGTITTSQPVLDTSRSFTVSAWAMLNNKSSDQVVAAAAGNNAGAFRLMYQATADRWDFEASSADTASPTYAYARSNSAPATATWTHLVGVYDASAGTLKLYVNGTLQTTTATGVTAWQAQGPFDIGHVRGGSKLNGGVDDVQVYQRVLTATEIGSVYAGTAPASDAGVIRTSSKLDQSGATLATTDARGNTTTYSLDEAGRAAVTTAPAVMTETNGGTPVLTVPVSTVGYDTFGEVAEAKDALGNITTMTYDAAGRSVMTTAPSYTPPGTSTVITPVTTQHYNNMGQVDSTTDALSHSTSYAYDQLGRLWKTVAPNTGATTFTYDNVGDQLSTTDPTGAVASQTYDYLGHKLTATATVRQVSNAFTTTYHYGTNGLLTSIVSPSGVTTSTTYDAAGEPVTSTDSGGNTSTTTYDGLGRPTKVLAPDNTYATTSYDMASRAVSAAQYNASGVLQSSTSQGYDADGNVIWAKDGLGTVDTFSYDATNVLTSQYEPISSTDGITSTFGYDANGDRTRFTDGRGNAFIDTYNTLGQLESQIEPATTAHPLAADRTFTVSYDANGDVSSALSPGAVTVSNTYDTVGDLTGQTGSGAEATTAARTFGYDLAGRMTSASAPGGTDTFGYDDRGALTSTSGPSGTSTFGYDSDGRLSSRVDAAGTTNYTYDTAGRVATIANTTTGVSVGYAYNNMSQPSQVTYGTGDTRTLGYDAMHRLSSDELKTSGGTSVAKITYGYDANSNETSKNTTGFSGSASNTYTYDLANRLTSWYNGTSTVTYAYDKSGNRVQAGSKTFTYDERNELLTGPSTTYTYTARGTLRTTTTSGSTTNTLTDAYGQAASQESAPGTAQTYQYDALGRVVNTGFAYSGDGNTLASDGTSKYTHDDGDALIGVSSGGVNKQAWTDLHTDVVGEFTPTSTTLDGSTTYDPLGAVLSSANMLGALGYQSGWTDFNTGRVNMLSRWYNPATGQFDSRDTASNSPTPDSANANEYGYANENPLIGTDPTGQCMLCSWAKSAWHGVTKVASVVKSTAVTVWNYTTSAVSTAWDVGSAWVTSAARWTVDRFDEGVKWVGNQIDKAKKIIKTGIDKAKTTAKAIAAKTVRAVKATNHAIADAYHSTVDWAKKHANELIVTGVGIAVDLICGAVLGVGSGGAAAVIVPTVCGGISGAISAGVSKFLDCNMGQRKPGTKCAIGDYLSSILVGLVGGAVGALVGGAVAGKLADTIISKGLGLLGRVSLGALTGAVSGAVAGAASGGVTAAIQYGTTCANSQGGCSWSGLGNASLQGAKSGAISGAIGGGVSGGLTAIRPPKPTPTPEDPNAPAKPATQNAKDGCTHSFAPNTKVLMADGSSKPIADVNVGDKVLSKDPMSGKTTAEPVQLLHINHDSDLVDVTVSVGAGSSASGHDRGDGTVRGPTQVTLHTTVHHPFWDVSAGAWVDAADLKTGDRLLSADGATVIVAAVAIHAGTALMRDLTVADIHTYYVLVSAAPVLVHNCDLAIGWRDGAGKGSGSLDKWAEQNGYSTLSELPSPSWQNAARKAITDPNTTLRVDTRGSDLANDFLAAAQRGLDAGEGGWATDLEASYMARALLNGQRKWESIHWYAPTGKGGMEEIFPNQPDLSQLKGDLTPVRAPNRYCKCQNAD